MPSIRPYRNRSGPVTDMNSKRGPSSQVMRFVPCEEEAIDVTGIESALIDRRSWTARTCTPSRWGSPSGSSSTRRIVASRHEARGSHMSEEPFKTVLHWRLAGRLAAISHNPVSGPFAEPSGPFVFLDDRPAGLRCPSRTSSLPSGPRRTPGLPSIEAPVADSGHTTIAGPRHRVLLRTAVMNDSPVQHLIITGRNRDRFACTRRKTSA